MKSKYEYRVVYNKDNSTYKLFLVQSCKNIGIIHIMSPILEYTDTYAELKKYIKKIILAFDKPTLDMDDVFEEIHRNNKGV